MSSASKLMEHRIGKKGFVAGFLMDKLEYAL